ncbi:XdhC family protein [Candidatus Uabimicrobium amorphum]|uniref:Putative xanthine dehydrogenase subunit A n=1 Tax=Uabimicrobium amorphum TaxID=2596890 RepID=A0A5S9IK61_UABAM|nr:XdhC/CoxI family protein [Candidatus Uabimicrobium amorphum]BBM82946.1 putative xanthine dehydrogenase subunit A [Candidatus Uabimicrobium amorphum]
MKEIHDIIGKIRKIQQRAVLATVVHIKGSTYRRPGARMLVTESQELVGAISGGCLEEDVRKKSQQVLEENHVQLVTYDMMSDDDIVWGLGLGCNGVVQVLLEPVMANEVPRELQFVEDCYQNEKAGFIAMIFEAQRQELVGRKYIYGEDDDIWQKIQKAKPQIFEQNKNSVVEIEIDNVACKVLVESIMPTTVVVFGAGFDAVPVVEFCKNLGWKVIICDPRETYLNAERFPRADKRIVAHPKVVDQHLKLQPHHFVIVMTHNYHNDLQVLKQLQSTPVSYIGMLGPKTRTQRIIDEIQEKAQQQVDSTNIFGPIGLDIGSETPEEIATAIIAEILAVKNQRNGGYLRQYEGSIH